MLATNEPRNGDFVAYLEELQRESAARLLAQSKSASIDHPLGGTAVDHPAATPSRPAPLTQLQADELLRNLASYRATAHQIGPAVGILLGVALTLYWFVGGSSLLTLLIGVGLLVWSIRRLRRPALRRAVSPHAKAEALVSQFFGKPPAA